ncbi:MAG: DPP IV N-terminal domain-containing protein, partial [Thermoanaerobaculia bacterium]|nr:DPP IV N-terminal domain-containing protein [Thermoanaerobaculia bacterium]
MRPNNSLPSSLALLAILLSAPPTGAQQLTLESLFDGLGEVSPSAVAWAPNGHELAYRWTDEEGDGLWVFDAERGESVLLVRPAALAEAEETFSLDAYHWAPGSRRLLFESNGDLFLYDRDARTLRQLTSTEAEESDPKFSPDGRRIAFVRDYDLYLIDLADRAERRLTEGGEKNVLLNGVTDWVYWEELWGRDSTGFWWSDDGEAIAYYQFDETPVAEYSLVDFQTRYPTVEWQKYPKAGTDNPRVRVGVLDLTVDEITWMATGDADEWYLPRVDWRPQGDLAIQRLNRDQNRLEVLRCQPSSGDCAVWIAETSGTWVDVSDDYRYLADGTLLWPSERSGFAQLYLFDSDGEMIRRLTDAAGAVTALAGFSPGGDEILYQAYGAPPLGALGRRLYRASLAGGVAEALSPADGWASLDVAPGGRFLLETWSRASTPPQQVVRDAAYRRLGELPYT